MEDTVSGVIVREVIGGSPAATAGLQMDDIVQKINTKTIANVYQAMEAIDSMKPGDQLTLEISRGGKTQSLTATLKGVAEQIAATCRQPSCLRHWRERQKTVVHSMPKRVSCMAGLPQGDVLTQFNGKAYSPADLQTFINGLHDTDTVKVTVERAGKPTDVQVAAAPLRALNVLNHEDEGLMFGVVPSNATNVQPSISRLPTGVPFDAIVYDSADQYWFVLGLEENGARNR
jgi:C-terminal processing protease CtpA/Prc